jgi:hypothetical protein
MAEQIAHSIQIDPHKTASPSAFNGMRRVCPLLAVSPWTVSHLASVSVSSIYDRSRLTASVKKRRSLTRCFLYWQNLYHESSAGGHDHLPLMLILR